MMAKFEINGKDHDLRIDFKAIQEIQKKYSPLEFVGEVLSGNINAFVDCLYFGTRHEKNSVGRKMIEEDVESKIEAEKLDMSEIMKLGHEVVSESFFFKKTVNNMLSQDPTMKATLEAIIK